MADNKFFICQKLRISLGIEFIFKAEPRMSLKTSARRKVHWNQWELNWKAIRRKPSVSIAELLAVLSWMPTHGVGGWQERCGKAKTGAPMLTRKLCEEREFFKNIRLEVLESAGIEYGKSLLLISFPNRNRELYTGSSHLPIGSGTNKLRWEQLYSHLLLLRNTRRPGRRTVSF